MDILLPVLIVLGIGLIAGLGLSIASVALAVPTDERVDRVRDVLPGANCGGCGYSGCDGYAEAVVKGECEANLCRPGGGETAARIGEILGVSVQAAERLTAAVRCDGICENVPDKIDYSGIPSCAAANLLYGGKKACAFACQGLGDCAAVCDTGAIRVENGRAAVNPERCIACGKCVSACPKHLITLIPFRQKYRVRCSNKDRGAAANKVCKAACIACGKCVKTCPENAIYIDNNVAVIQAEHCVSCGKCAEVCPKGCISAE